MGESEHRPLALIHSKICVSDICCVNRHLLRCRKLLERCYRLCSPSPASLPDNRFGRHPSGPSNSGGCLQRIAVSLTSRMSLATVPFIAALEFW